MGLIDKDGKRYLDISKGVPVQEWVFDLVYRCANEKLEVVRALDCFQARQLIGEKDWAHLVEKNQQSTAGICFSFMVEQGLVPVEQVRQQSSGTHYYKVKN